MTRGVERRWVRGAMALVAFLLLVVALVGFIGGTPARGQEGPAATVTVQEGDTLESLAQAHLPGVDRRDGVIMIMQANGMSGDRVRAGDVVTIPAR